jgi:single-stranded-DNA-specific exonuclease
MIWNKTPVDARAVKELSRRHEIDLLTASIATRRGITGAEQLRFLLEDDVQLLHNPFRMPFMAEAVERINAAVDSGERILIFGDRDVDGITAAVLLYESLAEAGADVQWMLPEGEEAYGLSEKAIDRATAEGIGLLLTVDCGVSNAEEIAAAAKRGIDTIVIDHHNPPAALPPAFAIVNPKLERNVDRSDRENVARSDRGYPFRDLSGCAVASKVDWALRFSRSPFFGVSVCLLNARPANEALVVEAVRLTNLLETERVMETCVPGIAGFEQTRLPAFVGQDDVIVVDAAAQARLLAGAFGPKVSISLTDLAPLLGQFLPQHAGKSLLRIQQESRSARYASRPPGEIDTLAELFVALVLAREKDRLAPAMGRMDLAALGTLADLMPLVDENRIIVRSGLGLLRASQRSGLRQLFKRKDLLGKRIGATDIAWQVSPLLNSAGRMGEPGASTRLLLATTAEEAEGLVDQLLALDARRRSLGESAWNLLQGQAKESLERTGGRCVLVHDERVQKGITGIMASRLQGFYKVPAIVIAESGDAPVGSIRCNRDGVIAGFFQRHASDFLTCGGHDFAGGFSIAPGRMDSFLQTFFATTEEIALPAQGEQTIDIDAEIPLGFLSPDLQKTVDLFEPYGEGNPPLAFLTRGLRVAHCELIGRKDLSHLKLLLDAGATKWPAVYWNAAPRFPADFTVGDTVDVVYRLGRNSYGGGENLQFTILDLKK